jgi:hypothetical protein
MPQFARRGRGRGRAVLTIEPSSVTNVDAGDLLRPAWEARSMVSRRRGSKRSRGVAIDFGLLGGGFPGPGGLRRRWLLLPRRALRLVGGGILRVLVGRHVILVFGIIRRLVLAVFVVVVGSAFALDGERRIGSELLWDLRDAS